MAYCPEDGNEMTCVNDGISFAEYHCQACNTTWQYDAEEGCYRILPPEENNN